MKYTMILSLFFLFAGKALATPYTGCLLDRDAPNARGEGFANVYIGGGAPKEYGNAFYSLKYNNYTAPTVQYSESYYNQTRCIKATGISFGVRCTVGGNLFNQGNTISFNLTDCSASQTTNLPLDSDIILELTASAVMGLFVLRKKLKNN